MTSVFIGGSRGISRLNPVIQERLDDLMLRGCLILIGDASGADKMVQRYLAQRAYRNVVVYCMSHCRNNLGQWPTNAFEGGSRTRDFAYYAMKDLAMARDAKCGVMFWDGASKGTLHNIENLIGAGKKVLVYMAETRTFVKVNDRSSLDGLLGQCDPSAIESARAQIHRKLSAGGQMSLTANR